MTSYFKSLDNNAVDPESTDILVLNAGFEERSSRAAENLDKNFANHILICQIDDTGEKSVLKIKETALAKSANLHELSLSTKSPIDIADNFIGAMVGIVGGELKKIKITVDITCFTHEILLIILKVIELRFPNADVFFLYTQAKEYDAENSPSEKWLSHGVREVRSILGYSGISIPSKQTHLVVLVGFESERALSVINMIEPEIISIGQGDSSSLSAEVQSTNELAVLELLARLRNPEVKRFEFPPYDFMGTKQVLESIANTEEKNVVVAPMNTKVSSIGAALFANENPKVQLVYSLAEIYNTDEYSTSKTESYWFSAKS